MYPESSFSCESPRLSNLFELKYFCNDLSAYSLLFGLMRGWKSGPALAGACFLTTDSWECFTLSQTSTIASRLNSSSPACGYSSTYLARLCWRSGKRSSRRWTISNCLNGWGQKSMMSNLSISYWSTDSHSSSYPTRSSQSWVSTSSKFFFRVCPPSKRPNSSTSILNP